jgi:hypothetical protein
LFEYRNREDADNFWRYKDKISIIFPFKLTKFEIQPYLADELFVDFDQEILSHNRTYGGFSFKLFKNVKGELFYLRECVKKSGNWTDTNVFGTKLKVSF